MKNLVEKSKKLSYILRHHPEEFNCKIDNNGWVKIEEIINNTIFTKEDLLEIVENDTRYEFSKDMKYIRACHGHSIPFIQYTVNKNIPDILYHGTSIENYKKILETQEIKKMNRTKVHLSDNLEKAKKVGSRHGKVIVLVIDSKKMIQDGFQISLSKDEVYLSENIPIKYILKTI